MHRILIGLGTPIGRYLASRRTFSECLTYKQALNGIPRCDEAVIIVPASKGTLAPCWPAAAASLHAAARVAVLSSIDVYSSKGLPLDETAKLCGSPRKSWLGCFEREMLESGLPCQILRLPDVFGPYARQGAPGCFLTASASKLNSVAIHQWYPLGRLDGDIVTARSIAAPLINLVPEPLPMKAVLAEVFPGEAGQVLTPAPYSRIKTCYAKQFGGSGGYIMSANEVLAEIGRHVQQLRDMLSGMGKTSASAAARRSAGAALGFGLQAA